MISHAPIVFIVSGLLTPSVFGWTPHATIQTLAADEPVKVESRAANRQREIEEKVAASVEYIELQEKNGKTYPALTDTGKTLKNFLSRMRKRNQSGTNWFANQSLTTVEESLLLDNVELLAEYVHELIVLSETQTDLEVEQLRSGAIKNLSSKWRILAKSYQSKWLVPDSDTDKLSTFAQTELQRRKNLTVQPSSIVFHEFAAFLGKKMKGRTDSLSGEEVLRRLREEPGKFIQEELDDILEEFRKKDPHKAREVEDIVKKYKTKAVEFRDLVDKKVTGKKISDVAKEVKDDLRSRSSELRRLEDDIKTLVDATSAIPARIEKAKRQTQDGIDELKKKAEEERRIAIGTLEDGKRKVEQEIENARKQLKRIFK